MESICVGREEAAKALDLSLRGVDYLIAKGKIRAIRVGRRVLIPRAEIEGFVNNQNQLSMLAEPAHAGV